MMYDIIIREATKSDAGTLSALAIQTYTDAFGHSMLASDLAAHLEQNLLPNHFEQILNKDTVLVAEAHGRVVGFVQFGSAHSSAQSISNTDQEVRRLYVHSSWQNKGIGTLLMGSALDHPRLQSAEHIFLDVWEHNSGARRFYERHGFHVIGERSFMVESGADTSLDLIMVRHASR